MRNFVIRSTVTRWTLLLAALLCAASAFAADSKPTQLEGDRILEDMQIEMARSKSQLHLENVGAPYFIDYRIVDLDSWQADAALGGIRHETRSRVRFLLVQVRIGDYKQDSSFAHGQGDVEFLPLDGDDQALRFQLWIATDKAYKQAVEALTEKQARLKQLTIDHPVDDFARAKPVHAISPIRELKTEREPWLQMLRDASGLYTRDPKVQSLEAALEFKAVNRYYVNSEGSAVRSGEELYRMALHCDTQADDGMRLERSAVFAGASPSDLPKAGEFVQSANQMVASLKELREAPLVDEDYHGPVLFSADSASTIFSNLVGENLLGIRPELGQNARVRGQFASSYKTRVLPDFLTIVDDPSLTAKDGTPLLGHYDVDDEGVEAKRVPLVENGVLVSYLLGREPIRDFPNSNGHGRAGLPLQWPSPGIGNMIVSPSNPLSPEQLKQKMIAFCKDRGLEYGYFAKTMGGPLAPRLLYRVWASDGREELVRGAVFGDLDQRSMRSGIVAAGSDVYVENDVQPWPHSIVAPSILFDDLEVKRQTSNKDKLPEYPAPAISAKK